MYIYTEIKQKTTFNRYKMMRTRLSTIYKIGSIICLCVFIASCDPGDGSDSKTYIHQLQVENTSNVTITLEAYDTYNEQYREYLDEAILKQTLSIEPNSKGPIAINETYSSTIDHSEYFPKASVDSLVLKFENEKGYYATYLYKNGNEYRELGKENWIPNKSTLFLVFNKDVRKEGDVYIFSITQEDYENAHVLP